MRKKNRAIKPEHKYRDLTNHPDPLVDMDPKAPLTHARFGSAPSTLVAMAEAKRVTLPADRRRDPEFEKKVRNVLKHGRG